MDGMAPHISKEEDSEHCSVSRKSGHRSFGKGVYSDKRLVERDSQLALNAVMEGTLPCLSARPVDFDPQEKCQNCYSTTTIVTTTGQSQRLDGQYCYSNPTFLTSYHQIFT